jgi:hypothetical protein
MFACSGWWTGPEYAGTVLKSVPQRTDPKAKPVHGSIRQSAAKKHRLFAIENRTLE